MQTVTMRRTALSSNSVTDTNRFVFCVLLPPDAFHNSSLQSFLVQKSPPFWRGEASERAFSPLSNTRPIFLGGGNVAGSGMSFKIAPVIAVKLRHVLALCAPIWSFNFPTSTLKKQSSNCLDFQIGAVHPPLLHLCS